MIRKNEIRKPQNAQLKEKGRTRKYAAEEKNIEKNLEVKLCRGIDNILPSEASNF